MMQPHQQAGTHRFDCGDAEIGIFGMAKGCDNMIGRITAQDAGQLAAIRVINIDHCGARMH